MSNSEATQLFRSCARLKRTGEDIEREIEAITRELGYLALAVMLAGSYVSETSRLSSNLQLFLPEYREHRHTLLASRGDPHLHQHSNSILSTWELSFAAVERQSLRAARLMTLLAFLNFDDIFLRLFDLHDLQAGQHNPNLPESPRWVQLVLLRHGEWDQHIIEDCFVTLQAYSLVSWQTEQGAYVVHELVHAWGHDRLEIADRQMWSLAALELLARVVVSGKHDLDTKVRIVPHIIANFTVMSSVYGPTTVIEDRDRVATEILADLLTWLGRWKDEYQLRVFHRRATTNALGEEHPETLTSTNKLATALSDQGKHIEAEEMHQQTLELRKKVLGLEHPDTLTSLNNLANVLSRQGKYEQAEEMHRQTLELRKEALGLDHPDTLTSMNNLAMVLSEQGEHVQAEEMHR